MIFHLSGRNNIVSKQMQMKTESMYREEAQGIGYKQGDVANKERLRWLSSYMHILLAGDPSSVPSNHIWWLTDIYKSSFMQSDTYFWPPRNYSHMARVHLPTCRHIRIHIVKSD